MARRTFVVVDVIEILLHCYTQRAKGDVARSVGVDRETVAKYVAPGVDPVRRTGPIPNSRRRSLRRECRFSSHPRCSGIRRSSP